MLEQSRTASIVQEVWRLMETSYCPLAPAPLAPSLPPTPSFTFKNFFQHHISACRCVLHTPWQSFPPRGDRDPSSLSSLLSTDINNDKNSNLFDCFTNICSHIWVNLSLPIECFCLCLVLSKLKNLSLTNARPCWTNRLNQSAKFAEWF